LFYLLLGSFGNMKSVAVIGGGVAGVACASALARSGLRVTVFENGRGFGGRLSTRHDRETGVSFDHGAPKLDCTTDQFRQWLESQEKEGRVARWNGNFATVEVSMEEKKCSVRKIEDETPKFVGTPSMSTVVKSLSSELPLDGRFGVSVKTLKKEGKGWVLKGLEKDKEFSSEVFDTCILAVHASRTADILQGSAVHDEFAKVAGEVDSIPSYAMMASFEKPLPCPSVFDHAVVKGSNVIYSITHDSAKPGRSTESDIWVAHATPAFARQHFDEDRNVVAKMMKDEFVRIMHMICEKDIPVSISLPLPPSILHA